MITRWCICIDNVQGFKRVTRVSRIIVFALVHLPIVVVFPKLFYLRIFEQTICIIVVHRYISCISFKNKISPKALINARQKTRWLIYLKKNVDTWQYIFIKTTLRQYKHFINYKIFINSDKLTDDYYFIVVKIINRISYRDYYYIILVQLLRNRLMVQHAGYNGLTRPKTSLPIVPKVVLCKTKKSFITPNRTAVQYRFCKIWNVSCDGETLSSIT